MVTRVRGCPHCAQTIHVDAKVCHHCGRSVRNKTLRDLAILGVVVVALLTLWAIFPNGPNLGPANVTNDSEISEKDQWLIDHGNSPRDLDDRFGSKAQSACSSGADDYLKSIANYDFKWDAEGQSGYKFDQISRRQTAPGMLTLISTRAMLSNGFGAFQRVQFYCLYNVGNGDVVGYYQNDPADDVSRSPSEPSPTPHSNSVVIYTPQAPREPVANESAWLPEDDPANTQ